MGERNKFYTKKTHLANNQMKLINLIKKLDNAYQITMQHHFSKFVAKIR